jgi:hypothetical protein
MLFLNISTDQIYIEIENEIINLDRNELENIIWPTLIKLYTKYKFTKVFLINWPGGFTNLRVWILALNLLNTLENWKIDIFSISKIDFFDHFVKKWFLPKKWIIYIWQKKNIRYYDFTNSNYETIKKEDIDYNEELFFDLVYETWYFEDKTINIHMNEEKITLTYKWQKIETNIQELWLKAEKIVEAKYFIQPIMWNQWQ